MKAPWSLLTLGLLLVLSPVGLVIAAGPSFQDVPWLALLTLGMLTVVPATFWLIGTQPLLDPLPLWRYGPLLLASALVLTLNVFAAYAQSIVFLVLTYVGWDLLDHLMAMPSAVVTALFLISCGVLALVTRSRQRLYCYRIFGLSLALSFVLNATIQTGVFAWIRLTDPSLMHQETGLLLTLPLLLSLPGLVLCPGAGLAAIGMLIQARREEHGAPPAALNFALADALLAVVALGAALGMFLNSRPANDFPPEPWRFEPLMLIFALATLALIGRQALRVWRWLRSPVGTAASCVADLAVSRNP